MNAERAVVLGPLGRLTAGTRGALGNLSADWHYEGRAEFAHEHLSLLIVLSADRNVTFASGFRILPRGGSPQYAHWEVECYHALVRDRGPGRTVR